MSDTELLDWLDTWIASDNKIAIVEEDGGVIFTLRVGTQDYIGVGVNLREAIKDCVTQVP